MRKNCYDGIIGTGFQASILPENIQDSLANEFLQEMEWESQWDKTLEDSQDSLDKLTLKAMAQYKKGETVERGFDEL